MTYHCPDCEQTFQSDKRAAFCPKCGNSGEPDEVTPLKLSGNMKIVPIEPPGIQETISAVEFGFRCAEKGMNLEATLAEFHKLSEK